MPSDSPEGPLRLHIVTTVREPGPALDSFIRYHLAVGAEHIFVFFDDPDDRARSGAQSSTAVTAVRCTATLRQEQERRFPQLFADMAPFFQSEVMARQIVNAQSALQMAWERGAHWLLHIDVDELFYSDGPIARHFANLPPAVGRVTYLNYEAVPERADIDDYFREVTLFKRNRVLCAPAAIAQWQRLRRGESYFSAYDNGKAAVRVSPGASVLGVHSFKAGPEYPESRASSNPAILHFPNCGFENFWRKYQQRGRFSDNYFERTPRIAFHLRARDVVMAGDREAARAFYLNRCCATPEECQRLIESGLAVRITHPREILMRQTSERALSVAAG
jgi:Glycosyl transferase family 2